MKSDNSEKRVWNSTGNSSLGREDHVRQVSPDRHQATVHNRHQLKIGTFNVQTMLLKGKVENVKQEMKRRKINILRLSEMRWKGAGCITPDGYKKLYSGGEHHYRGVCLTLDPETSKAIKGFWTVKDRTTIIAKLQGKSLDIGLIQIYAPTADKETTKKAMKQLKSLDIRIVMEDFNSKVGSKRYDDLE